MKSKFLLLTEIYQNSPVYTYGHLKLFITLFYSIAIVDVDFILDIEK